MKTIDDGGSVAVIELPKTNGRKEKAPLIPAPNTTMTARKPLTLTFHVGKDYLRKFDIPQADSRKHSTTVYHMYPKLSDWIGRATPDGVNPRSHDPECLKSPVAKQIEATITDSPDDFYLANRGCTLIVEDCQFEPKSGNVTLTITDPENQGLADGASSDAVLAKVQTRLARELLQNKDANFNQLLDGIGSGGKSDLKMPDVLSNGRIHLEVFQNIGDRSRIANLVQGRNTSRQVRGWSMSDFKGHFDWIKEVIEKDGSQFKGKVGYEENSGQDISVLDIMSELTLFHPEFDLKDDTGKDRAPVIAYSNKGRMDGRLTDETLLAGYKGLSPLIPDIIKLYDYVYANFERSYDQAFAPKARLGRREGVESRLMGEPYELPMTGIKSNYIIPNGYIFPLLAAFRALVSYRAGKVSWKVDPFEFYDKYGKDLVAELIEQVDGQGGNPNIAAKRKLVYTALHNKAKILLNDELEERREAKK